MKKISLITLLVIVSVANATPENGFYIGADIGVSNSAHKAVYKNVAKKNNLSYKFKNTDITYGIHTGYKFNPYFATELFVGHLGKFNITYTDNDYTLPNELYDKYNFDSVFAFAKVIFPATKNIDLYAKTGIGIIRTKYTFNTEFTLVKGTLNNNYTTILRSKNYSLQQYSYSIPIAIGTEFTITDNLTANLEYQYIHHVRHNLAAKVNDEDKIIDKKWKKEFFDSFKPSMHSTTVGLTYYFGTKTPVVTEPKPIALASEALFKFGGAKLNGNGVKIINELAEKIKQEQIDNQSVVVSGHTDKLGSAQFNLKLSEQRAKTVAKQLTAKGVHNVSAIGYGFDRPVTGEQCAEVKERKALIECYAPDRRVEIQITGQK